MPDAAPQAELLVQDLDTLKTIIDPLRGQILELMVTRPLTVRQVAERLGLAPSRLYYHVNLLEKYGLIQVAATRLVANLVEKSYRATALSFRIDESLLALGSDTGRDNISAVLKSVLDTTRADLLRSLEARATNLEQGAARKPRTAVLTRQLSRLSLEQAAAFRGRLQILLDEFTIADDPAMTGDGQTYALTVAFYPTIYYADDEPETST